MMTLEQFEQKVVDHILIGWKNDYQVSVEHISKNNGTIFSLIRISRHSDTVVPVIYLDDYYLKYQGGMDFRRVIAEIRQVYDEASKLMPGAIPDFADFQAVKKRIIYRLINYKMNKELLENCPYILLYDLAVTFRCVIYTKHDGLATARIDNRMMESWGITVQELFRLADSNTQRVLPPELISMDELLEETGVTSSLEADAELEMYIATNRYKLNGASVILYKDYLKRFSEQCGRDFYVLPSSIHEMIFVPVRSDDYEEEKKVLGNIVREANQTVVERQDILSDHVYIYRRKENRLEIAF